MGLRIGGGLGPFRGGVSTRGVDFGVGPVSAGASWPRTSRRSSGRRRGSGKAQNHRSTSWAEYEREIDRRIAQMSPREVAISNRDREHRAKARRAVREEYQRNAEASGSRKLWPWQRTPQHLVDAWLDERYPLWMDVMAEELEAELGTGEISEDVFEIMILELDLEEEQRQSLLSRTGTAPLPEAEASSAAGDEGVPSDLAAQLTQLAELHAAGHLDDREYSAAKAKILDEVVVGDADVDITISFSEHLDPFTDTSSPSDDASNDLSDEACLVGFDTTKNDLAVIEPMADQSAKATLSGQISATAQGTVWAVSSHGRLHRINVAELPRVRAGAKGAPFASLAGVESGEALVAVVAVDETVPLVVATAFGRVKRIDPKSLSARAWPLNIIALRDDDRVVGAAYAPDDSDVVLVSSGGQLLRTPAGKIRPQGRAAGGVAGIALPDGEVVLTANVGTGSTAVAVMTDAGRSKQTATAEYPQQGRGGKGVRCVRFLKGEQRLVAALVCEDPRHVPSAAPVPLARRDGSAVAAGARITSLGQLCR